MLWSIQLPFGTSLQGKSLFFFFLVKKRSGCTLYMLGVVVAVVVVVVVAVEFSDVRQALYTCSKSAPRLAPQETQRTTHSLFSNHFFYRFLLSLLACVVAAERQLCSSSDAMSDATCIQSAMLNMQCVLASAQK